MPDHVYGGRTRTGGPNRDLIDLEKKAVYDWRRDIYSVARDTLGYS